MKGSKVRIVALGAIGWMAVIGLATWQKHASENSMPIPSLRGARLIDQETTVFSVCFDPQPRTSTRKYYELPFEGDIRQAIRNECRDDLDCTHSLDDYPGQAPIM